jgi:hypothetical protein
MRVGEHFNRGGKEYEITHVLGGKVWAREASGKNVETITVDTKKTAAFDAKHPAEVTVPSEHVEHTLPSATATMMKGGKAGGDITVVDADARDAGPHDPSIPLPKDSSFTAEEWAGFGRLDQLHYAELQGHFGKWDPQRAKAEIKAIAEKADASVLRYFNESISRQYGSSSGWSMTLASAYHNVSSFLKHESTTKKKQMREEAKVLAAQHQAVIHWDLYNRVRAPEVTVFHRSKSATGPWDWEQWTSGKEAVFPGISTSWNFGASGLQQFGPRGVAFPMAVRHTLMSSYSAQPIYQKTKSGSVSVEEHYPGEYEIASPFKLRFDPKRVLWFDEYEWQKKGQQNTQKWLVGQTKGPAGPEVWNALKEHMDGIAALPPAPAPAEINMHHQSQTWLTPPEEAFDKIADRALSLSNSEELQVGDVFSAHSVAYRVDSIANGQVHGVKIKSQSSTPLQQAAPEAATVKVGEPVAIARPVSDMGVKPGDFVMGQAGTRYLIVADPGEPHLGLRYMPEGGGQGWPLYSGSEDRRFFMLDGHYSLPKAEDDTGEVFDPHKYVNSGDKKFVGDMAPTEKFTVAGNAYEVKKQLGGGYAEIKLLSTGALGTINTDYQTPYLIPADDKMKAKVKAAKPDAPPTEPTPAAFGDIGVGDHFAYMGAVMEKTSPGKAKVVALQPGSGLTANFVGTEQSFSPDTKIDGPADPPPHPAHTATTAFHMDDYAPGIVQVSQKNLDVGSIHLAPSTGAPLKLVAKDGPGGDYTWENLATGEKSYFLPHSVKVTELAPKPGKVTPDSGDTSKQYVSPTTTNADPMAHPDAAEAGFAGYKYHKSATKTYPYVSLMPAGTVFKDAKGKHWKVKQTGAVPIVTDGEKLYHVPKGGRGLVMDYHEIPGGDTSPSLAPEEPYEPEHPSGTMLPNLQGHTLGELPAYGVGPGNTIDVGGKDYLIVSAHGQTGWIYTTNTATGKPKVFAPGTVPDGFSKEKQPIPEQAQTGPAVGPPEGEGLGAVAHNPDDFVSGEPKNLSELGPGQKFVDANGVHGSYVGAEADGAASVDVLSGPYAGTQTVMAGNAPVHTLIPKQIVANAPGEPEPPEPSAVLGNLSVGTKITMHDDGTVTFDGPSSVVYHGNAGTLIDTNGVSHLLSPNTPVKEPTPAEELADYQFDVAHFEVGSWKKLKDMEVGEHFKAVKTHTAQKVVAQNPDSGETTIESNGKEYVVSHNKSRETWIKKASAPANATHIIPPPGAPTPTPQGVPAAVPEPEDPPSLKAGHLAKGDYFTKPSYQQGKPVVYRVASMEEGTDTILARHPDGSLEPVGKEVPVTKVDAPSQPAEPPPEPAAPKQPGALANMAEAEPGDTFTVVGEGVWTVMSVVKGKEGKTARLTIKTPSGTTVDVHANSAPLQEAKWAAKPEAAGVEPPAESLGWTKNAEGGWDPPAWKTAPANDLQVEKKANPDGTFSYLIQGKVHTKAGKVNYSHANVYSHPDTGNVVTYHKSEAAALKAKHFNGIPRVKTIDLSGPAPAAPAAPPAVDKTPGTAVPAATDLAVGDHFAVKENPHYPMQVTKVEGDQVTYTVPNGASYTTPHEDLDDLVWAQPLQATPDPPGKPAAPSLEPTQTTGPGESPPFKWNAHVAGPRMKVQKMPVGTLYHDNQGGVYRVTGHEGGKTQIVQVYSVYSQHIGKTYDVASNHSSPTVVPFEKPDLSGATLGDKQPLNAQPVGSIVDFNGTPLRVLHHGTKKTTVKDASKPGWSTMELHGSFPVRPHVVEADGASEPLVPDVPHAPAGSLPPLGSSQAAPLPNVIQGYKFHKSATKKYPFIGKVEPGATVQDAAGKQFVVLSHEGGQTIYRDSAGLQYVADAKTRVWVIEGLQEAADATETAGDAPDGTIEGFVSRWAFAGYLAHEALATLREGASFRSALGEEYLLGAVLDDGRALVRGSAGSFTVPAGTLVERIAA